MPAVVWDYNYFKNKIYYKTGLDLDSYKDRQMERRIRQLMQREKYSDYRDYFKFLERDSKATERFLNYLTINTSEFYRDEIVYRRLLNNIIPSLLEEHLLIKVWSAGCSIGAEPYSLAILFQELNAKNRYKIIATDIDVAVLNTARNSCYSDKELGKMPEHLIRRYFEKQDSVYCVRPILRHNLFFKHHNLLRDPPEKGCHLIMCRNVFIYFKFDTQEKLVLRFSDSLVKGGYLITGLAEYISEPDNYNFQKKYPAFYQKQ